MSPRILVDSCLIIDHLRAKDKSTTLYLETLNRFGVIAISVITEYEILNGLSALHRENWNSMLEDVVSLPLGRLEIQIASQINRDLKSRRRQSDLADILIAATAMAAGLPLATLNVKHFERIDGLELFK